MTIKGNGRFIGGPALDRLGAGVFAFLPGASLLAEPLREAVLSALSAEAQRNGLAFTVSLPLGGAAPRVLEVEPQNREGDAHGIARLLSQAPTLALVERFVSDCVARVAHALSMERTALRLLTDQCYLRLKGRHFGRTRPHADVYFMCFRSHALSILAEVNYSDALACAGCGGPVGPVVPWAGRSDLHRPQLCDCCGTSRLTVVTGWWTLGELDLRSGSRLQLASVALERDLHDVTALEALRECPANLRGCRWLELDEACGCETRLRPGEGLLFDVRVLHRGVPGRTRDLRVSVDLRFVVARSARRLVLPPGSDDSQANPLGGW